MQFRGGHWSLYGRDVSEMAPDFQALLDQHVSSIQETNDAVRLLMETVKSLEARVSELERHAQPG